MNTSEILLYADRSIVGGLILAPNIWILCHVIKRHGLYGLKGTFGLVGFKAMLLGIVIESNQQSSLFIIFSFLVIGSVLVILSLLLLIVLEQHEPSEPQPITIAIYRPL